MPEADQAGSKNNLYLDQGDAGNSVKETSFIEAQQRHRHHSNEQHRKQQHRHRRGADHHHGRHGRPIPPFDTGHHHHHHSSEINPVIENPPTQVSSKKTLHADIEVTTKHFESDISSQKEAGISGNRRRVIIRRSATLQHQSSTSSAGDLNRLSRPPGSNSFDDATVRTSSTKRLLTRDPALSQLVNGDRSETTTTLVSEAETGKTRSRTETDLSGNKATRPRVEVIGTSSTSSSIIRFNRSFPESFNSSTDPLTIQVAKDHSLPVVSHCSSTPGQTVMGGLWSSLRRRWWRWRYRFSPCCRRKFCFKGSVVHSPSGFQIDNLSRTNDGHHTSEMDTPRLQPHCSFGPAEALFASFRSEGRVTTACLWHACRVVTLGGLLVIMGITMAILGYYTDQQAVKYLIANGSMPSGNVPGPGIARQEGFHLNNFSFAGPVVMGVGGFLIVAACVMIFESRDSTGKIVPVSTAMQGSITDQQGHVKVADSANFCSSSSQTTFLDRNIVQNLSVTAAAVGHTDSSSKISSIGIGIAAPGPGSVSGPNMGSLVTMTTLTATGCVGCVPPSYRTAKRPRPKTVPASYTSGSGSGNRSASFSHLPEVDCDLPLMDEIGRRALTNAFIRFTKETGRRRRFLYNPAMDAFGSPEHGHRSACEDDEYDIRHPIPKCPSAPNIHHHKLYHSSTLPAMTLTPASASASSCQSQQVQQQLQCQRSSRSIGNRSNVKLSLSPLPPQNFVAHNSSQSLIPSSSSTTTHGMYRVLTPTMYRSRMASTRQAVSMDYEDGDRAKLRREGPCIRRDPSPFSLCRPGTLKSRRGRSGDNSLDLELGASATRVHQIGTAPISKPTYVSPTNGDETLSHRSGSSLALDLHVEGGASITLLVRDESRSTRSMTSSAPVVTNSFTDSSSQSRDQKDEIKLVGIDDITTETDTCNKKETEWRETSFMETIPIQPIAQSSRDEKDVILIIEEDDQTAIRNDFNGDENYDIDDDEDDDSLILEEEEKDTDDDQTLAAKIASFEYIDDTDADDEELEWSPLDKEDEVTLGGGRKRSFTSITSSPIQSELDVWSPTVINPECEANLKRKETAELQRHLMAVAAKQLTVRCASAESLSQDSRLTITPNHETKIVSSHSFTADLEKRILSNDPRIKSDDNKTGPTQEPWGAIPPTDKQSPEAASEPVGPLRRCSTKRYALVRQSKVVGEKQRTRIKEKPQDEQ